MNIRESTHQDTSNSMRLNDSEQRELRYRRLFLRLLGYIAPYRGQAAAATVAMLIYSATVVAIPLIVKEAVDRYIASGSGDLPGLTRVAALLMAVAGIQFVVGYLHRHILVTVGERMLYAMRAELFDHIQSLAVSFFDQNRAGRIMSRVQGDVQQIRELITVFVAGAANSVAVVGVVVAMLLLNLPLALVSIAVVLTLLPILNVWQRLSRAPYQRARQTLADVNSLVHDNVSGIRVIQSLNRQRTNIGRFDHANQAVLSANVRAARYGIGVYPSVQMLTAIGLALVVVVGGNMVLGGALEIGVVLAFALYIERLFDPVRRLTRQFETLQQAMVSADRIFELLDISPDVADRPNAASLSRVRGDVRFENVNFHYSPDSPVLHDIDLRVQAGETVAIVGPTGAGKTTLISLLLRYYDVVQGRITLDGHEIRDVELRSLSRQVGVVLQEPYLFSETVRENIRYNRTEVSDEQIERAARAVRAHQFILDLERGYDTPLLERGANLSVGQRQLISFARALAGDPRILILNEATASIDTYTEVLIQQALGELLKDRTALVIAHRLSTVRNADRIVVMDEGRIVEQGSHDQLIGSGGLYSRLQSYTVDTG